MLRIALPVVLVLLFLSAEAQSPIILLSPPKYGAYHWNPDYRSWDGSIDRLNWGAGFVKRLGFRTIRVELAFDQVDSYGFDPAPIPGQTDYLLRIAQTPEYHRLFSYPDFTDYLLTTYTPQAYFRQWGWGLPDLESEREEYRRLADHLGRAYPGKRFILLNWEGDNDLHPYRDRASSYQAMLAMRVGGIRAANMPNVKSGVEINCARDGQGGACDLALVSRMIPLVEPDYVSYSIWATINPFVYSTDPRLLEQALLDDIDHIVAVAGPRYWGGALIIGEYGRQASQPMPAYDWFRAIDLAARKRQVPYTILWQALMDRPEVSLGYGAFDPFGNITENGMAAYRIGLPLIIWPPKKGK